VPIPIEIESILARNSIQLTDEMRRELDSYVRLLMEWNSRVNLISRRDEQNIWKSHILHSIAPLIMVDLPRGIRALDLGTGGGLPGIPIGILNPGMDVTLLDSIRKKTAAIEAILDSAGLKRLKVINGRAEDVGRLKEFAGVFDLVMARAVAPLVELVRWSAPFLRRRGLASTLRRGAKSEFKFPYLLALKGGDLEREVAEVRRRMRVGAITEIPLTFPGSEGFDLVDKKMVIVEFP
jgi:16S rRNA (guanine527-N7)-methyltransferase